MEMLELMKTRRSIRRFTTEPVERNKLEAIVEAGLYAPNAGSRQGAHIIMLEDPALIERIGIVNASCENRARWTTGVNTDQPSIIDDPNIKSGFYSCTALAMVCINKEMTKMVNPIGTAFTCAENMVIQAASMDVSSCIVGRGEATFAFPEMRALLDSWGIDENLVPVVFVCLGYRNGPLTPAKPRKEGRVTFVADL